MFNPQEGFLLQKIRENELRQVDFKNDELSIMLEQARVFTPEPKSFLKTFKNQFQKLFMKSRRKEVVSCDKSEVFDFDKSAHFDLEKIERENYCGIKDFNDAIESFSNKQSN